MAKIIIYKYKKKQQKLQNCETSKFIKCCDKKGECSWIIFVSDISCYYLIIPSVCQN